MDLVSEQEAQEVEDVLHAFNPKAQIVRTERGRVDLKHILNTGRFSFDEAAENPGWLAEEW